jgi:hypothetical protein
MSLKSKDENLETLDRIAEVAAKRPILCDYSTAYTLAYESKVLAIAYLKLRVNADA